MRDGEEQRKLYVSKRLHHFFIFTVAELQELARVLKQKSNMLAPYTMFAGRGYLKPAATVYLGIPCYGIISTSYQTTSPHRFPYCKVLTGAFSLRRHEEGATYKITQSVRES